MATRDRKRYSQAGGSASIGTTGNSDLYVIAPVSGKLKDVLFSGIEALAANDSNYINWSITNLGQAGACSAAMLAAINGNTTKATGGSAIAANTKRGLTVSSVPADITVQAGDRLRIRAAVTGTLGAQETGVSYLLTFDKGL